MSGAITLALVAYLGWQAFAAPKDGEPIAEIRSAGDAEEGGFLVEIVLRNDARTGLLEVEVSVACAEPLAVTFENVPARGERSATVRCDVGDPAVDVAWWTVA